MSKITKNGYCANCVMNIYKADLAVALKVFKYFYREQKLLSEIAFQETERITGIDVKIIESAANSVYKEEEEEIIKFGNIQAVPVPEPNMDWPKESETIINHMNYFPRTSPIAIHGDYFISQIRYTIMQNYYKMSRAPTFKQIIDQLRNNPDLPNITPKKYNLYADTIRLLLKYCCGFYIYKLNKNIHLIFERQYIVERRNLYLNELKKYRNQNKNIYYTWIKIGYSVSSLWKDIVGGLVFGYHPDATHTSVLIHVANENSGLIHELSHTMLIVDNNIINLNDYEKWFARLMLHTTENSLIIFGDYTPFYSKYNETPNQNWNIYDIKEWLLEKCCKLTNITHNNKELLLQNVYIENMKYNIFLDMAKRTKKNILFLPPHHHELNIIEMLWQDVKNKIRTTIYKNHGRKSTNYYNNLDTFDIISNAYEEYSNSIGEWNVYKKLIKKNELMYLTVGGFEQNGFIKQKSLKHNYTVDIVNKKDAECTMTKKIDEPGPSSSSTPITTTKTPITETITTPIIKSTYTHAIIPSTTAAAATTKKKYKRRNIKILQKIPINEIPIIATTTSAETIISSSPISTTPTTKRKYKRRNKGLQPIKPLIETTIISPSPISPTTATPEISPTTQEQPEKSKLLNKKQFKSLLDVIEISPTLSPASNSSNSSDIIEVPLLATEMMNPTSNNESDLLNTHVISYEQLSMLTGNSGLSKALVLPEYNDLSPESIPVTIIPTKHNQQQILNTQKLSSSATTTAPIKVKNVNEINELRKDILDNDSIDNSSLGNCNMIFQAHDDSSRISNKSTTDENSSSEEFFEIIEIDEKYNIDDIQQQDYDVMEVIPDDDVIEIIPDDDDDEDDKDIDLELLAAKRLKRNN